MKFHSAARTGKQTRKQTASLCEECGTLPPWNAALGQGCRAAAITSATCSASIPSGGLTTLTRNAGVLRFRNMRSGMPPQNSNMPVDVSEMARQALPELPSVLGYF